MDPGISWLSPSTVHLKLPQYCQSAISSVVQSSPALLTPWTAAHQSSLSITKSQSLFKIMSIESVMSSNHLILCRTLLLLPSIFPSIRIFSNELVLCIRVGQNIGVSASSSILPMNIQDWFPLGLTGWISLQSKDSQESSPAPQFESSSLWSSSHIRTWLWEKNHSFDLYRPLLAKWCLCFLIHCLCSL